MAPAKRNLGGQGAVVLACVRQMGLNLTIAETNSLNQQDKAARDNKARKQSHAYKLRQNELQRIHKQCSLQEKKESQRLKALHQISVKYRSGKEDISTKLGKVNIDRSIARNFSTIKN